jgi:hypothetical protein
MRIGINPSFHGPSSRAIVFADAMLRARPPLDPVGTRLFSDVELPAGVWTLGWSGSGRAQLNRSSPPTVSSTPETRYTIEPGDKRPLQVSWTGDVRDLKVWLPNHAVNLWYQPFVELLRHLRCEGGLRTLDWTRTNEGLRERDPRTQWVVSFENQVRLANKLGVPLHVPLPINAPEGWLIDALWQLSGLDEVLELTLEVGNELWNPSFYSYKWLYLQPGRHVEAAAKEIDRVFAIVERELPRAKHFVGGQLGNPWYMETLLQLVKSRVDSCGPAVYMRPKGVPESGEQFAQGCMDQVSVLRPYVAHHKRLASSRGAELRIYEGGPHPDGKGSPAVAAGMRSPKMAQAVFNHAKMLEDEGVDTYFPYSLMTSQDTIDPPPHGHLEDMTFPSKLPKAHALAALMRGALPYLA